jgi:predicted RNase H-like HicB family nuclease
MANYTQTYTVVIKPARVGWQAYCLEIPGCTARGQGKQAAYKAVKEAIRVHLRQCISMGKPIPRRDTVIKYPRLDLRKLGFDVDDLR